MKVPGPDHPISIEQSANRVQIIFNGRTVAESDRALTLYEAGHPPRLYVPRKDADMSLFERSARTSHCPYKGDAAYYSVRVGDQIAENAVWTRIRRWARSRITSASIPSGSRCSRNRRRRRRRNARRDKLFAVMPALAAKLAQAA
jgi:uncharacterized protein (DUF427 family)